MRSIGEDPRHIWTSPFTSYNWHGKGNYASMVDAAILGATEVDVSFNANVNTHSDGMLLHGIGGWQNCLFSGCTILKLPSRASSRSSSHSATGAAYAKAVPVDRRQGAPAGDAGTEDDLAGVAQLLG